MRFILILGGIAVAAIIGLRIYGEMVQPDTRVIEQEAMQFSDE